MLRYNSIPSFQIENVESVSEFLYEKRIAVSKIIVDTIERGLNEDLLELPVMELCILDMPVTIVTVQRERFAESLQKCLNHFLEAEEYEECARVVKLLDDQRMK